MRGQPVTGQGCGTDVVGTGVEADDVILVHAAEGLHDRLNDGILANLHGRRDCSGGKEDVPVDLLKLFLKQRDRRLSQLVARYLVVDAEVVSVLAVINVDRDQWDTGLLCRGRFLSAALGKAGEVNDQVHISGDEAFVSLNVLGGVAVADGSLQLPAFRFAGCDEAIIHINMERLRTVVLNKADADGLAVSGRIAIGRSGGGVACGGLLLGAGGHAEYQQQRQHKGCQLLERLFHSVFPPYFLFISTGRQLWPL